MNTGFYENIDINFEQACEMSEKEFTHEELLELLKNGNIPEKQIAALKLDKIESQDEAEILISNLTGCDGKIREAVALKINQLLKTRCEHYFVKYPTIFADSSIDINGNICRLVIDSVDILKTDSDFSQIYLNKILDFINETFNALDKFIFRDKKYVINKQLFKLYWCLESLKLFANDMQDNVLYPILERASVEKEYTIREKVAQIVKELSSDTYNQIKTKLLNDENYYVRAVFNT